MAQWLSFSIVAVVLTVLVLALARQSQELIEQASESVDGPAEPSAPTGGGRATATGKIATDERQRIDGTQEVRPGEPEGSQSTGDTSETARDGEREASERETGERETRIGDERTAPVVEEIELTPKALHANVAVTQGLVAAIVVAAAWYFAIPASALGITDAATSIGLPAVAGGLVFGFVLWVGNEFSTTVADAVGAAYDEGVREMLAPESTSGWLVLFGVVLPIIAVSEELLFRAALIGVPAAGFGVSPWLLAVASSLAFAFGHGAQGQVGIVVTGLLGFVLAAGYILSGSLLLVVVAHYVINALEFLVHEYVGHDGLFDGLASKTG